MLFTSVAPTAVTAVTTATFLVILICEPVKVRSTFSTYFTFTGYQSLGEFLRQEYCDSSMQVRTAQKSRAHSEAHRPLLLLVHNLLVENRTEIDSGLEKVNPIRNASSSRQRSKLQRFLLQRLNCLVRFSFYSNVDRYQLRSIIRRSPQYRHKKLTIIFEFDDFGDHGTSSSHSSSSSSSLFTSEALQALDYLYERCRTACFGRPFIALFSPKLEVEVETILGQISSNSSTSPKLRPDFRLLIAPERILNTRMRPTVHLNPVLDGCKATRGVYLAYEKADFDRLKMTAEQCNLQGARLNASYNNILPFCNIITAKNGTIRVKYAIETEILKVLEARYNFSTFFINANGSWGRFTPGKGWSGAIGHVYNGTSDLGLCYISRTLDRLRAVSFSSPIFVDELTFMSLSPKLLSRDWLVFAPFNLVVWLCNLSSGLLITVVAYGTLHSRFASDRYGIRPPSAVAISLQLYAVYLGQSGSLRWEQVPTVRLLYGFWVLAVLILANSYGGCFYSILAVPEFERPIDTLADVEAIARSDSGQLVTFADSSYLEMFVNASADAGLFYAIGQHLNRTKPQHVTKDEEAVKAVEEDHAAAAGSTLQKNKKRETTLIATRLYLATVRRVYSKRQLHIGREIISMDYIAYIFGRGSPLREPFSLIIKRMYQTGLIEKLLSGTFNRLPWKPGASLHSNPTASVDAVTEPLALADLRSIFILWSTGLAAGTVVLLHESLAHCLCQRVVTLAHHSHLSHLNHNHLNHNHLNHHHHHYHHLNQHRRRKPQVVAAAVH